MVEAHAYITPEMREYNYQMYSYDIQTLYYNHRFQVFCRYQTLKLQLFELGYTFKEIDEREHLKKKYVSICKNLKKIYEEKYQVIIDEL